MQSLDARVQLSTANGDNIKMHGYKEVDIIIGNIDMHVRFYVCDVSAPILGFNDLINNNVELNLRNVNDSYLQQHGHQELTQYIGGHFYIPAILTEANKLNVSMADHCPTRALDSNVHYSQTVWHPQQRHRHRGQLHGGTTCNNLAVAYQHRVRKK